jgi:hypothetical protein
MQLAVKVLVLPFSAKWDSEKWMSVKWTIRRKEIDEMYLQGNGLLMKCLIGKTSFR